jgi:hypothetical protein
MGNDVRDDTVQSAAIQNPDAPPFANSDGTPTLTSDAPPRDLVAETNPAQQPGPPLEINPASLPPNGDRFSAGVATGNLPIGTGSIGNAANPFKNLK